MQLRNASGLRSLLIGLVACLVAANGLSFASQPALAQTDTGQSWKARFVEAITGLLATWSGEDEAGGARVEAMSRGAESTRVAIPLLASAGAHTIVAGDRVFRFAWTGGKPPFSVTLTGPAGPMEIDWKKIGDRSVASPIHFDEGPYEIRVKDSGSHSARGSFEAIVARPAIDSRGLDLFSPDVARALLAARLAALDDGAWTLEAYLQVASAPDGQATRTVAERLAVGLSVSELQERGTPRP